MNAQNFKPLDIFGGAYIHKVSIYRQDGDKYEKVVENLRAYVDRPAGAMRFGDIILHPDYNFKVLLSYRYYNPQEDKVLVIDNNIVKEGGMLEVEYDGQVRRLIVKRRYSPASFGIYLSLECEEVPIGTIEPLVETLNP